MTDQTLTPEVMLNAYASGVFPMSEDANDPDLFWVDPKRRGIFELDNFHVSRSLKRRINKGDYDCSINTRFRGVISACADRETTWINKTIFDISVELHEMGLAHSFEITREGQLIGGVYGIALGSVFFGDSMFSRATDGSKLALYHLTEHLKQRGFTLFDTQFITPHLASLGGTEISRAEYHRRLSKGLDHHCQFA